MANRHPFAETVNDGQLSWATPVLTVHGRLETLTRGSEGCSPWDTFGRGKKLCFEPSSASAFRDSGASGLIT